MNKKILVGSIIAVAILVGISFTSVVGYRSVTSDVKESPLFTVRISRVLDTECKNLTCDYIGMGEESIIQPCKRKQSLKLIQRMIDTISNMNDKEFNQFLNSIFEYISKENIIKNRNFEQVISLIYQIRIRNSDINYIFTDVKGNHITRTYETCFTPTVCLMTPGCILLLILDFIIQGIIFIAAFFWLLFNPCSTSRLCTLN